MHLSILLTASTLLSSAISQATFSSSSKRGLVFIPSKNSGASYQADNQIWVRSGSDLTWYYNYGASPSTAFSKSQADFEFVPMLWSTSTSFLTTIKSLISGGRNITHVMTFNEPDGTSASGGADLTPAVAAASWIEQVEPLRKMGVKAGAPAVTGSPGGFTWLSDFFAACQTQGTNCTADFFPVHWYGNFEGLASHLGQVAGTYVASPSY